MRISGIDAFSGGRPPEQLIATGCPGSGKSHQLSKWCDQEGVHVVRTTFHQESSYGDFVGAYKPSPIYVSTGGSTYEADMTERKGIHSNKVPVVHYDYRPGPFISAYVHALKNPDSDVVLIVEEINRANPAAVFGDMIQLLDRDAEGRSVYAIDPAPDLKVYLGKEDVETPGKLRLPPNLLIWGTMNRADESVSYIDSAFLRRWVLKYFPHTLPCSYDNEPVNFGFAVPAWKSLRHAINSTLEKIEGIEEDKFIGPYFLAKSELSDIDKIFSKLVTYLWHDVVPMERSSIFVEGSLSSLYAKMHNEENVFSFTDIKLLS
jgi:GTPase subunit of restriction endonuclease